MEGIAYPTQTVEITGQTTTDVESRELTEGGWTMRESHAPYEAMSHVEVEAEKLADGVQEELLAIEAGRSSQFKGRIYDILLQRVRTKFLDGEPLAFAEAPALRRAAARLNQLERLLDKRRDIIGGMIEYAGD